MAAADAAPQCNTDVVLKCVFYQMCHRVIRVGDVVDVRLFCKKCHWHRHCNPKKFFARVAMAAASAPSAAVSESVALTDVSSSSEGVAVSVSVALTDASSSSSASVASSEGVALTDASSSSSESSSDCPFAYNVTVSLMGLCLDTMEWTTNFMTAVVGPDRRVYYAIPKGCLFRIGVSLSGNYQGPPLMTTKVRLTCAYVEMLPSVDDNKDGVDLWHGERRLFPRVLRHRQEQNRGWSELGVLFYKVSSCGADGKPCYGEKDLLFTKTVYLASVEYLQNHSGVTVNSFPANERCFRVDRPGYQFEKTSELFASQRLFRSPVVASMCQQVGCIGSRKIISKIAVVEESRYVEEGDFDLILTVATPSKFEQSDERFDRLRSEIMKGLRAAACAFANQGQENVTPPLFTIGEVRKAVTLNLFGSVRGLVGVAVEPFKPIRMPPLGLVFPTALNAPLLFDDREKKQTTRMSKLLRKNAWKMVSLARPVDLVLGDKNAINFFLRVCMKSVKAAAFDVGASGRDAVHAIDVDRPLEAHSRECPICCVEWKDDEQVVVLRPCKHYFHFDCISTWMARPPHRCPSCRADVVMEMKKITMALFNKRAPVVCKRGSEKSVVKSEPGCESVVEEIDRRLVAWLDAIERPLMLVEEQKKEDTMKLLPCTRVVGVKVQTHPVFDTAVIVPMDSMQLDADMASELKYFDAALLLSSEAGVSREAGLENVLRFMDLHHSVALSFPDELDANAIARGDVLCTRFRVPVTVTEGRFYLHHFLPQHFPDGRKTMSLDAAHARRINLTTGEWESPDILTVPRPRLVAGPSLEALTSVRLVRVNETKVWLLRQLYGRDIEKQANWSELEALATEECDYKCDPITGENVYCLKSDHGALIRLSLNMDDAAWQGGKVWAYSVCVNGRLLDPRPLIVRGRKSVLVRFAVFANDVQRTLNGIRTLPMEKLDLQKYSDRGRFGKSSVFDLKLKGAFFEQESWTKNVKTISVVFYEGVFYPQRTWQVGRVIERGGEIRFHAAAFKTVRVQLVGELGSALPDIVLPKSERLETLRCYDEPIPKFPVLKALMPSTDATSPLSVRAKPADATGKFCVCSKKKGRTRPPTSFYTGDLPASWGAAFPRPLLVPRQPSTASETPSQSAAKRSVSSEGEEPTAKRLRSSKDEAQSSDATRAESSDEDGDAMAEAKQEEAAEKVVDANVESEEKKMPSVGMDSSDYMEARTAWAVSPDWCRTRDLSRLHPPPPFLATLIPLMDLLPFRFLQRFTWEKRPYLKGGPLIDVEKDVVPLKKNGEMIGFLVVYHKLRVIKTFNANYVLHSFEDAPAMCTIFGQRAWYRDGRRHRDGDFPALVEKSMQWEYFDNGYRHRANGKPAYVSEYMVRYFEDGFLHRANDLPAVMTKTRNEYWTNGLMHRDFPKSGVLSEWQPSFIEDTLPSKIQHMLWYCKGEPVEGKQAAVHYVVAYEKYAKKDPQTSSNVDGFEELCAKAEAEVALGAVVSALDAEVSALLAEAEASSPSSSASSAAASSASPVRVVDEDIPALEIVAVEQQQAAMDVENRV